jgi:lipopolysaccharide transport system ATP-binding protein
MNGSILGMRRAEITKKFDEIVAFSGVEKFLDTPLKHYSSGMQLRLAFSVAAHLDPDILIVDEVLAVGDAEFQKRCLGKMNEVRNDGKTLLFVSHSLQTLRSLCQSGLLLNEGKVLERGTIQEAIHRYTSLSNTEGKIIDTISYQRRDIIIRNLAVNGSELNSITVDTDEIFVEFECDILHKTSFDLDRWLRVMADSFLDRTRFSMKDPTNFDMLLSCLQ